MDISIRNYARLHMLLGFIIFGICILGPVKDMSDKVIVTIFSIAGGLTMLAMLKGRQLCLSDKESERWEKAGIVMQRCIIAFVLILWICSCATELFGFGHSANSIFAVPMAIGAGIYTKGSVYLISDNLMTEGED